MKNNNNNNNDRNSNKTVREPALTVENRTIGWDTSHLAPMDDLLGHHGVADAADGLGAKLLEQPEDNRQHVHAAGDGGVENNGVAIHPMHQVQSALAVRLERRLGLPDDAHVGPVGVLDERQARADAGAGGDDDDLGEHAQHVPEAVGGHAALPEVGGLVVDGGLGPVADLGHDARELGVGRVELVGEAGEAVPVLERVLGDRDALPEDDLGVLEVQADGVGGEGFGLDLDLAQHEPWVDGGDGEHDENPEGGQVQEEVTQAGLLSAEQDEQDPEEHEDDPVGEAVGQLEVVVQPHAERGVGDDDDGEEEAQHGPDEGQDGGVDDGWPVVVRVQSRKANVPDYRGHACPAVDATKVEDLASQAAEPDGRRSGDGTEDEEEGVDDKGLTAQAADSNVDGGSIDQVHGGGTLDHHDDKGNGITHEGYREETTVDGHDGEADTPQGLLLVLILLGLGLEVDDGRAC